MEEHEKMVFFDKYCTKCKYETTEETDDPCNECLSSYTNFETRKPVKFEEKE